MSPSTHDFAKHSECAVSRCVLASAYDRWICNWYEIGLQEGMKEAARLPRLSDAEISAADSARNASARVRMRERRRALSFALLTGGDL